MRMLTEQERKAIVDSIKNGWSNSEILSWAHRTMKKDVTIEMLKDIRYALKTNPDYPEKKWITMSKEERETIIIRIIEGEMTITQAEKAYRAGNGCGRIKKAVDNYRTAVKPNTKQAEKQTAEQTTLYNKKEYDYENSIKSVIKIIESGAFPYSITQDESGTTLFYSDVDEYGNAVETKIFTKKRYQISLKEIEQ